MSKLYKICIVYKPSRLTEKCVFKYAFSAQHAKNIGGVMLKQMYGSRRTGHVITVKQVK